MKLGQYYNQPFTTGRGVNQGYPLSLTVFNIVVNAVIRDVMLGVCGLQEEHHGLVWTEYKHEIVFY